MAPPRPVRAMARLGSRVMRAAPAVAERRALVRARRPNLQKLAQMCARSPLPTKIVSSGGAKLGAANYVVRARARGVSARLWRSAPEGLSYFFKGGPIAPT